MSRISRRECAGDSAAPTVSSLDATQADRRLKSLLDSSVSPVVIQRHGALIQVNDPAAQLLGFASAGELLARGSIRTLAADSDATDARRWIKLDRDASCGRSVRDVFDLHLRAQDGSRVPVEVNASSVEFGGERCLVAEWMNLGPKRVFTSKSTGGAAPKPATKPLDELTNQGKGDRRRLERRLAYQATHDPLTGLANRGAFENSLSTMVRECRENESKQHALAYIDLDQFKLVNDTCGHSAGDELLRKVAEMFGKHAQDPDLLARIGGDEFALLMRNATADEARERVQAVLHDLSRFRFHWNGAKFDIGASVGIAPIKSDTGPADEVLGRADIACYAAKDGGRHRAEVYGDGLTAQRHREMRWPAKLTRALEEGHLHLASQPIVSVTTVDNIERFELLLRMRDDEGQWIQPGEFIPAAERFNMMASLDRWVASWVLREMLRDEPRVDEYLLAINVSGNSLNDDKFLDWLLREIEAAGGASTSLCIEVTETAAVRNLDNAATFIRGARAAGCKIALDDFGSGLSSFAYLDTREVDIIKIDGRFVRSMASGGVAQHVVGAVAQLGQAMGVTTIAEHVEDRAAVERLTELGIDLGQGFYYARPTLIEPYAKLATLPRARIVSAEAPVLPVTTERLAG